MNKIFNFDTYKDFDFYHMKYGKGAVIIAIPYENATANVVAALFHRRDNYDSASSTIMNPISAIQEMEGFIRVIFEVSGSATSYSSAEDTIGTIERVLSNEQVTFEIVK